MPRVVGNNGRDSGLPSRRDGWESRRTLVWSRTGPSCPLEPLLPVPVPVLLPVPLLLPVLLLLQVLLGRRGGTSREPFPPPTAA